MQSEEFDITPANHACHHASTEVVKSQPNTSNSNTSNDIQANHQQHQADSQYDNADNIEVKPMYGGNKNFSLLFEKKNYKINSNNEINAIKQFLNNKIFKKDKLIVVNNGSTYLIKKNYKNKFKKIL